MPYVQRDGAGKVIGKHARPQPGRATEFLDPAHADLQPTLAAHKLVRYVEIDLRTQELIAGGFVHAAKTFSLSLPAQHNWHGLLTGSDNSWLSFPVVVGTIDNDTHSLSNAAAVGSFVQDGFAVVFGHLSSGRTIKKAIFDAANRAAVDAVEDTG